MDGQSARISLTLTQHDKSQRFRAPDDSGQRFVFYWYSSTGRFPILPAGDQLQQHSEAVLHKLRRRVLQKFMKKQIFKRHDQMSDVQNKTKSTRFLSLFTLEMK